MHKAQGLKTQTLLSSLLYIKSAIVKECKMNVTSNLCRLSSFVNRSSQSAEDGQKLVVERSLRNNAVVSLPGCRSRSIYFVIINTV